MMVRDRMVLPCYHSLMGEIYVGMSACFRFEPITIETAGVYGESTAALISEIGRRITEVTGESRETLWLKQDLVWRCSEAMRSAY